jgi:hypothetical protein
VRYYARLRATGLGAAPRAISRAAAASTQAVRVIVDFMPIREKPRLREWTVALSAEGVSDGDEPRRHAFKGRNPKRARKCLDRLLLSKGPGQEPSLTQG